MSYTITIKKKYYETNNKKYVCVLTDDILSLLKNYKGYKREYKLPNYNEKYKTFILHIDDKFEKFRDLITFKGSLVIRDYDFTNEKAERLKGHYLVLSSPSVILQHEPEHKKIDFE